MTKRRACLAGASIALSDEQATSGWFHVLMTGEWEGHPSGAFKIDEPAIDAMIARFSAQRTPMMVDWNHRSLDPHDAMNDGRAAGFISKLEKREGETGPELWAFAEWNAPAVALIRSGEYRYCSPVIDWEAEDRTTGDVGVELFNVALTNQPFLDGQHAISLHRITRTGATKMPAPKKSTKLADEMPPKDDEETAAADDTSAPDDTADVMAAFQLLAEATGMSNAELVKALVANADSVAKAIKGDAAPMADEVTDAIVAELTDARAEIAALKDGALAAKPTAEAEVEAMIKCGRVKESRKPAAIALLKKDRAMFSRVWPEGTQEVRLGASQTGDGKDASGASTAPDAQLTHVQRVAYDHLCKMSRNGKRVYSDEQALANVLKNTTKDAASA